ncbi:MAG: ABC transporter ATP-binding protein [Actinomycetes bacterium]
MEPAALAGTQSGTSHASALDLRFMVKRFGAVTAVNDVNLAFSAGEVHALLGENGAGKSTLMNLAAGFLAPDQGEIWVGGRQVRFGSPRDALAVGIGMVHQHFRLVDAFTVAENLAIGADDVSPRTSSRQLNKRADLIAEQFGMPVQSARLVGTLSVGEKQRVEILRTLSRGTRVLILDEPTAVLTPEESEGLCENLRQMAAQGTCIIFISHKLKEVLSVADRISVMRKGNLHATVPREGCDVVSLSRMMFDDVSDEFASVALTPYDGARSDVVVVEDLVCSDDRGAAALRGVSFTVRDHEVLGVVGVAGNGQQELEQVITGLRQADSGTVRIGGEPVRDVRSAMSAGLAHIPEDRMGSGLVGSQTIWRNAIMRNYRTAPVTQGGVIRAKVARAYAADLADRVDLSTRDVGVLVQHLSGGNAQKLLVGREFDGDRRAVVAVNPTQGLDVKAATTVRTRLLEARDRGLAVLLISADLDEVLTLSDRVVVIYEGRIVGEFTDAASHRDVIGRYMGGGHLSAESPGTSDSDSGATDDSD